MTKPTVYMPREQEVIDSPDYFLIRVFQQEHGWIDSARFTSKQALERYNNIKKMWPNMRAVLYAARHVNDEERLACVTPAYLSALVELHAAQ